MFTLEPYCFEYAPRLESAIYKQSTKSPIQYAYIKTAENGVRCCLVFRPHSPVSMYTCCTKSGKIVIPSEESIEVNGPEFYHIVCQNLPDVSEVVDIAYDKLKKGDRLITHNVNLSHAERVEISNELERLIRGTIVLAEADGRSL